MKTTRWKLSLVLGCLLASSCSGKIDTVRAQECSSLLTAAEKELDDAKVQGFGGSIQFIKAANLLALASTQKQLERFDSCVDKAQRARIYIREAQKK